MSRAALIAGVGALAGLAAWWYMQDTAPADSGDGGSDAPQGDGSSLLDEAISTVKNITTDVSDDTLALPNVQAFLTLIRTGEGTLGTAGYRKLFGGGLFNDFADHPRVAVTRGGITSTAAGAYQQLSKTWDEMAAKYNLPDFSPHSQDIAALGLIKRRGALADVIAGRFRSAIDKTNKEWASLPGSPYGQPTLTYDKAAQVLAANGADITGAIA